MHQSLAEPASRTVLWEDEGIGRLTRCDHVNKLLRESARPSTPGLPAAVPRGAFPPGTRLLHLELQSHPRATGGATGDTQSRLESTVSLALEVARVIVISVKQQQNVSQNSTASHLVDVFGGGLCKIINAKLNC